MVLDAQHHIAHTQPRGRGGPALLHRPHDHARPVRLYRPRANVHGSLRHRAHHVLLDGEAVDLDLVEEARIALGYDQRLGAPVRVRVRVY
eukprot:scaffold131997_cov48-Phaeocystis_antarctica.AAC.1